MATYGKSLRDQGFKVTDGNELTADPLGIGRSITLGAISTYEREGLKFNLMANDRVHTCMFYAPNTASGRDAMLRMAAAIDDAVKRAIEECLARKQDGASADPPREEGANVLVRTSLEFIAIMSIPTPGAGHFFQNPGYAQMANAVRETPSGPTAGSLRVFRGGGWNFDARFCRSARRGWFTPDDRFSILGFRLAFSSVDASGR